MRKPRICSSAGAGDYRVPRVESDYIFPYSLKQQPLSLQGIDLPARARSMPVVAPYHERYHRPLEQRFKGYRGVGRL